MLEGFAGLEVDVTASVVLTGRAEDITVTDLLYKLEEKGGNRIGTEALEMYHPVSLFGTLKMILEVRSSLRSGYDVQK